MKNAISANDGNANGKRNQMSHRAATIVFGSDFRYA